MNINLGDNVLFENKWGDLIAATVTALESDTIDIVKKDVLFLHNKKVDLLGVKMESGFLKGCNAIVGYESIMEINGEII
jgi:hypothetical protein